MNDSPVRSGPRAPRVLVLGAGAIGLYVGALLARAGAEVVFGVRSDAARRAIASHGVRLIGPRGDLRVSRVSATDRPADALDMDVVLSCVKLYDAQASSAAWRPALESARAVVSLQNGIDGADRIRAGAPAARCWRGYALVAGRMVDPGVVEYTSALSSIVLGGPGVSADPALAALAALAGRTDAAAPAVSADDDAPLALEVRLVEDIARPQWTKLMALATNAALTCLTRRTAGDVYGDPDLLALARRSIDEVLAVGRAEGVPLERSDADAALALLQGFPPGLVASMRHDLDAGRPLELDGVSGLISRLGRAHGVPTPFHDFAWACLKPWMHGRSTRC